MAIKGWSGLLALFRALKYSLRLESQLFRGALQPALIFSQARLGKVLHPGPIKPAEPATALTR
jgi:hypothetical protein